MKDSITQEHNYGCGIACVAFVAECSYQKVTKDMGIDAAQNYGFWCKELTAELTKFGLNYIYRYLKPAIKKDIYAEGSIVFIERSKKYPAGHYLARHKGQWMDPWINFINNQDIQAADSGFRKRLPGRPIYLISKCD